MQHSSLVLLIVIHVLFDFVLQSREIAKNKSSKFNYLLPHLFILSVGLGIYSLISGYNSTQSQLFVLSNVILHGIIDWNIWNLYKYLAFRDIKSGKSAHLFINKGDQPSEFMYWEDSKFYNFIALDQALHGFCYIGLDYIIRSFI